MGESAKEWAARFGAEWEYVMKLGSAITDPESKKAFWESVKEKKLRDSSYSIYSDFPKAEMSRKRIAQKYCGEILEMLKGRKNA